MKLLKDFVYYIVKFFELVVQYKQKNIPIIMGRYLLGLGCALVASNSFSILANFKNEEKFKLSTLIIKYGESDGSIVGISLIALGLSIFGYILIKSEFSENCILIHHCGMPGMNTNIDPKNALPQQIRLLGKSAKIKVLFEHKWETPGELINWLKTSIESKLSDLKSNNIPLFYAGLAPVPELFCIGEFLSSRQGCRFLDWNRDSENWNLIEGVDDREKLVIEYEIIDNSLKSLSLVLSFSAEVSMIQLPLECQKNIIIVRLENDARRDSLDSKDKQDRIGRELYNLISNFRGKYPKLKTVNLFMASQASFCVHFGRCYSRTVHPRIRIYNFDGNLNRYTYYFELIDEGIKKTEL